MDVLPELDSRPSAFALVLVFLAGLAVNLVCYGVYRFPGASLLGISGAVVALLGYAAVGFTVVRSIHNREPAMLVIATRAGLVAAAVFGAGICIECVFPSTSTVAWRSVEFGLAALIYLWAGAWLTIQRHTLRDTMLGTALAAMMSLVIWCFFALTALFLQRRVLRIEMENLFSATFVRLIMGPFDAAILAALVFGLLKLLKVNQRSARAKAASPATK